jgi:hypothetical protein
MSWFFKILDTAGSNVAKVDSNGALIVAERPSGAGAYCVAAKTGTIGAAAAANANVFAMRLDPGSSLNAYIDSIRLKYTTIVAFTTPITQTRSLVIKRGSGAAASGGTAIATVNTKDTSYAASEFDAASGGDVRIATTGALTITGITFETVYFAEMTLSHVGTAGAFIEYVYEFSVRNHPIEIRAGQVLSVAVGPSAMDAAGTWSLGVEVNWHEGTSYTA